MRQHTNGKGRRKGGPNFYDHVQSVVEGEQDFRRVIAQDCGRCSDVFVRERRVFVEDEPLTEAGRALMEAMRGCWGYDEAPEGDDWDGYAEAVLEAAVTELPDHVAALVKAAWDAAVTLSKLRPHMKLETQEQWDELEAAHNRLARATKPFQGG